MSVFGFGGVRSPVVRAIRRNADPLTVIGTAVVPAGSVGTNVRSGSWATVPGVRVAGTGPCALAVYSPVYPKRTGTVTAPSTPSKNFNIFIHNIKNPQFLQRIFYSHLSKSHHSQVFQ
jgi:hypothetical protein